ncbi:hypothetical protein RFI_03938 [Reticulomyxa filosa]|uniref:Uncharacterized protein n=1 Tax=Reticulomyxa filosa TaxID=46433 RepID=X6P6C7_RETFI|nr:hypothetical protein RFI_03938 [Reticulomyxa filosa]|eukprot:ETO33172.1 hypothetical protein RFI_03938 [Reticulomyxa filosa]
MFCFFFQSDNSNDEKQLKKELAHNDEFSNDLKTFFKSLKSLSEHQQLIVKDYQTSIDTMEADLIRVRHEITKIRQNTFAKIYDLHKYVEIADALDLGQKKALRGKTNKKNKANPTEIERERRHFATKVQRQLSTLQAQLKEVNVNSYVNRLDELINLEAIMSNSKAKAFFTVFVQLFYQALVDVDLFDRQINAEQSGDANVTKELINFYGIRDVLNKIDSPSSPSLGIKVQKTMRFIKTLQNAIFRQQNDFIISKIGPTTNHNTNWTFQDDHKAKEKFNEIRLNIKVKIEHLVLIVVFVGRKLSYDQTILQDVRRSDQISQLAELRCHDIFRAILNDANIFTTRPCSITEVTCTKQKKQE